MEEIKLTNISELTEEQEIKKVLLHFIPCNACKTLGWKEECYNKAKCGEHLYYELERHFYEKRNNK